MACFSPLTAWQLESGEVVFAERGKVRRELTLPCGQCVGCRLERSRQWAVRCMHEASLHEANAFITLTYSPENLPADGSLHYEHFQLFMKRLRKRVGCPVRFYMCGEYGERNWRPHFHACIFGYSFPDKVLFKRGATPNLSLYTSGVLSSIWTDGFASVGQLSFDSAAYVARYVMKKVTGNAAQCHYAKLDLATGEIRTLVPEFNRMSLRPGIGADWFFKYHSEVYPRDGVVVNGVLAKPPRYYDKLLTEYRPATAEFVELLRYRASMEVSADNTAERLRVREAVTHARLSFKQRSLE